uniref:Uncharacterized protein n=1 Tax=viral metagenome TaxID=1070528 RepID=A0A6C0C7V8_9ZZZZ
MAFLVAFLILLFISNEISAAPLPLWTPFNYHMSSTGYIINGTFDIQIGGLPAFPQTETTLVIDPQNNRMVFDWTQSGGGINILFAHDAYFFGQSGMGETCTYVPDFGYMKMQPGYATALSQPKSTTIKATCDGLTQDVGGCGHDLSASMKNMMDVITQISFAQRIPFNFIANRFPTKDIKRFIATNKYLAATCQHVNAVLSYDLGTIDRSSNRDAYFVLPTICETPVDYCSAVYYSGNPCIF